MTIIVEIYANDDNITKSLVCLDARNEEIDVEDLLSHQL